MGVSDQLKCSRDLSDSASATILKFHYTCIHNKHGLMKNYQNLMIGLISNTFTQKLDISTMLV